MSLDDLAEQAEQRFRDLALATKLPELKPTGNCYNCSEPIAQGVYCNADCRDDHVRREQFNRGRQ
ncbi:hypothetical protein [Sideroxydans lithotrophicus]|uniref:DUF2116 family Zn-ribbon domain-containing protein n=1 Tax=Sideroxydans lithotrophicus (strain ES-1) TaxID=580332 RepID=D5CT70_SIDLE|nr:hypothetical protein [Sideroxydans lithotrophicus]ADE12156.1 conserved hypothetical protein [Sideroxydans lithotrophicus ES-1]